MKKILRTLLIVVLAAGAAKAQFLPFNKVINITLNRGISPANDTTAAGVASKFYESPNNGSANVVGTFFPNITDGAYRLRALSYSPTAEFKLVGGDLSIKNATSGVAKIAAYNIVNANAIAKFSFKLDLTNYTGANAFIVAFGNVADGSILTNSSAPFTTPTTDIFGSFRIIKSGNLVTQFKPASGTGQTNTSPYLIKDGVSQVVEVFVNSTELVSVYTYAAAPIIIPANTYHVYVDGTRHAEDFPKVGTLYTQTEINAISFTTGGSATQETVKISDIQVTYPSATDPTLPVSLTSFTGEKVINGIRLNWKTASELNNDHFDILRSTEGQTFSTLTSTAGKGTSNQVNTYSYLDNAPEAGINYYKLKQVDKDGTATISDIVVAVDGSLATEGAFSANIINNTLNAQFDVSAKGTASISVTDLSGRKVFTNSFSIEKGFNNISLGIPSISAGIYVVTLTQNGQIKSVKILK